MALVTLNFNPVEAARREPLPEGSYEVQVSGTANTISQAGNPMVKLELDIIGDPAHTGRRIFDTLVLTDKVAWKLVQFMDALRLPSRETFDPTDWVGKTCYVDIIQETYQDSDGEARITNRVKKYRAGN